jgi:hypothetical protein
MPPEPIESSIQRITAALAASPARRRQMRDELLGHLSAALDADPTLTPVQALLRLGDPDVLRRELQSSVPPLERFAYRWFFSKEIAMLRLPPPGLLAAAFVLMILWGVALPEHIPVIAGMLLASAVAAAAHALQSDRPAVRRIRRRLPWIAGIFGILIGPALILPALAKHQRLPDTLEWIGPFALGALITLTGVAFLLHRALHRPAAAE